MQQPLTKEILMDPTHSFVKTLIYIYSMQSFVFGEMNKASRDKDYSKIHFYGPLASALALIIHHGNQKTSAELKDKEMFHVYRGLQVKKEELDNYYKVGNTVSLQGFTSSTMDREIAKSFSFMDSRKS